MRPWIFPALTLALLSLPEGRAAWGPRGCAAVVAPVQADGWHVSTKHPGWQYQIAGGQLRAWWNQSTGEYIPVQDGRLMPATTPPWERSSAGMVATPPEFPHWMTHGVETAQIGRAHRAGPAYTMAGQDVSREDALALVGKGELPDDAGKCRLTIVCRDASDPRRKRLLDDIASRPELAELRTKCVVQDLSEKRSVWLPDGSPTKLKKVEQRDFALEVFKLDQDKRYQASGFAVYFQGQPNARGQAAVQGARYDYTGDAEAIRRIDPLFDPNKIDDGRPKPKPPEPPAPAPEPKPESMDTGTLLLLMGGAVAVFLLGKSRRD